jgi:hypothetical protein
VPDAGAHKVSKGLVGERLPPDTRDRPVIVHGLPGLLLSPMLALAAVPASTRREAPVLCLRRAVEMRSRMSAVVAGSTAARARQVGCPQWRSTATGTPPTAESAQVGRPLRRGARERLPGGRVGSR